MPVEIKELHIKIHVDEASSQGGRNASSPATKIPDLSATVEEIMEIIRHKKER